MGASFSRRFLVGAFRQNPSLPVDFFFPFVDSQVLQSRFGLKFKILRVGSWQRRTEQAKANFDPRVGPRVAPRVGSRVDPRVHPQDRP